MGGGCIGIIPRCPIPPFLYLGYLMEPLGTEIDWDGTCRSLIHPCSLPPPFDWTRMGPMSRGGTFSSDLREELVKRDGFWKGTNRPERPRVAVTG